MKPIRFNISVYADLLDTVRSALEGRVLPTGQLNKLEDAINRLRYVEEAEFGHLNYATLNLQTARPDAAARRMAQFEIKARKAIRRWAARLPRSEAV